MEKISWGILALLAVLVGIQGVAFDRYADDQSYLKHFLDQRVSPSLPPSEQAKQVLSYFRGKPTQQSREYFLLPVFAFLRPSPRQSLNQGPCASRSRAMIALLALRGINASKWALYSEDWQSQHAVVEVEIENHGRMAIDPLFGLWFPRPGGGYYGIDDLQKNPEILRGRIRSLLVQGSDTGFASLRHFRFDRYSYDHPRTINWNKSYLMEHAYWLLHALIGDRVDRLPRPSFVEQPALMVIYALVPLDVLLLAILIWSLRLKQSLQEKPACVRALVLDGRTPARVAAIHWARE